ncbi:hypothetical protein Bca4012_036277 [Brassica carinata]
MKSLADQAAKSQSISQGTLMEVYEYLLDLDRDVVRDIITIDFCNTVDNCVKRAEISQLIILCAVKQFEAESDLGENIMKKKKKKNRFCFWRNWAKLKAKVDKKQRNVKTWRRLCNVVFMTAFVSVLILSVTCYARNQEDSRWSYG